MKVKKQQYVRAYRIREKLMYLIRLSMRNGRPNRMAVLQDRLRIVNGYLNCNWTMCHNESCNHCYPK